jgi:hypothetical protein
VLTSLGQGDQFIAKYRKDPDALGRGVVEWVRTLPGSGVESKSQIPGAVVAATRLAYNSLTGAMHVSGDFSGTLTLNNLTLNSGTNRHGFVAALTSNQPPVASCQNVTVTADANSTANASINNGSADPDSDAITLSQSPAGPYPGRRDQRHFDRHR